MKRKNKTGHEENIFEEAETDKILKNDDVSKYLEQVPGLPAIDLGGGTMKVALIPDENY